MALRIDHVTIAGPELASMEKAFADIGLATDYGGPHSNGITHMALLRFQDGSYLELISTLEKGRTDHQFWPEHIAGNAGPCAWAVEVNDVAVEAARVAALGVPVEGPFYYHRQRPDGIKVEWDLAFLGAGSPGATLPFIIKDRTPREWRVRPSPNVSSPGQSELSGVAEIVLGTDDLHKAIDLFRRVYDWADPQLDDDLAFGATLAHFPGTPVTLATPHGEGRGGWLSERLERFGEAPCAYLLGTADLDAACARFGLSWPVGWFNRRVAWFDSLRLHGVRLGLVASPPGSNPQL